jgi:23S rRNA pseudouridine1911/1915/1917 synthase
MKILYEDETVLAIDKPSGMMVHTDGRSSEPTVVDWVRENYPKLEEVGETQLLQNGEEIKRPGIVHRLDRETSGVLLIAKTQEMFLHLKNQFQEHTIEKEYRAFVHGVIKEDALVIDRAIGKSSGDFRKWSAQRGARGVMREARTDIEVIARGDGVTYIKALPKTGRTHQIRVHLKAIHHPVLCDPLYGFSDMKCPRELGRLALHAESVTFSGLNGEKVRVSADEPASFKEYLDSSMNEVLQKG